MLFKKFFIVFFLQFLLFANDFDYKSFKTDFEQIVYDNQNVLKYSGTIYYKDNKSLWEYKKPDEKLVYITKEEVLVVDKELEQVVISKENINLQEILKKLIKIDENMYLAKYEDTEYLVKTNKKFINTIDYKDDLGNKVKIIFTNSIVNNNIDDKIFEYKIPNNYDIIR